MCEVTSPCGNTLSLPTQSNAAKATGNEAQMATTNTLRYMAERMVPATNTQQCTRRKRPPRRSAEMFANEVPMQHLGCRMSDAEQNDWFQNG